jgi:ABC-type nitrate/sulfonate/bicarbonate transport system ATPase subunit
MRAKGAMKAEPEAVELTGVSFGFGDLEVLRDVSLRAESGEVVALVGPSGCGKSTLLELIAGLRHPDRGRALTGADDVGRIRHVALMPQRDCLLPWLSAADNAGLAPRNRGSSKAQARAEAEGLLERFGLGGFAGAAPSELSGGMRQRVAFARTLLAGKPVICLDEPFASLDAIARAELQEWLAGALAAEARTVVMVSHDVEEALYLADRVLVMSPRPGRIVTEVRSPAPRSAPRSAAIVTESFLAARSEATSALGAGA